MKLNVQIDERMYQIEVPEDMAYTAKDIFAKMDREMDNGWQMSREWVQDLDATQRCQVAANRLLTAVENNHQPSMMLMSGYILYKMPSIQKIFIDTQGDMTQTQLYTR